MTNFHCSRCIEAGIRPDYFASDRVCGFNEDGEFTSRNWQCGTLNQIRELAEQLGFSTRYNDTSICFVPLPDEGFIVLAWYKNRGRVDGAHVIMEEQRRDLTLRDAELALSEVSNGN